MATPHVGVPLPQRTTDYVRVVYAKVAEPVSVTCLSANVVGTKMHFGVRNSIPCIRDYTECAGCKQHLKKLWYGWVLGTDRIKRGTVLVQMTEAAVRNCAALADSRVDLRGAKIDLERIADANGSIVVASVIVNTWADHSKKPDPDVWAALMRFYRIELPTTTFGPHDEWGEV